MAKNISETNIWYGKASGRPIDLSDLQLIKEMKNIETV